MIRIGMVIGTVPEKIDMYKRLHDGVNDENREICELLKKHNYQNYNIFLTRMDDGKEYLFGYYEYVGDDLEKDIKALEAYTEYKDWLKLTGSCQTPLSGEKGWKVMDHLMVIE